MSPTRREVIPCEKLRAEKKNGKETVDFETAIALTGQGRFHYRLMFGCGFCLVAMVCELYGTSYLLPAAQCDFQMSAQEKGLLNSISLIGVISSSHLWGYLADTKGRRKILMVTLAMDAVCAVISCFAPTFYIYLVVRYFCGFFVCGPSAIVYAYIGEFHAAPTRARAIVFVSVVVSIASIGQPGLAWLVIPRPWSFQLAWFTFNSWRVFVFLCAVPSILTCLFLLFFLPESPKYYLVKGREEEALTILRRMYSLNNNKSPDDYPVKSIKMELPPEELERLKALSERPTLLTVVKSVWQQTAPLFCGPHLGATLLVCSTQFGLFTCFNGLSLWLPEVFNIMGAYSASHPESYATACEIIGSAVEALPVSSDTSTSAMEGNASILLSVLTHEAVPMMVNRSAVSTSTEVSGCDTSIDPSAFQNTLIVGVVATCVSFTGGYIVNYVGKKKFLLFLLVTATGCGFGLNFATTTTSVLILSCVFVTFSGLSANLVSSTVVDVFPTHLRAMAVCLALMMGRVGAICGSLMIGALIEVSCTTVFYVLSTFMLVCVGMTWFLPIANIKTTPNT